MKKLFLFNILVCLFALQGLAQTFTYQDENGTWGCQANYNYDNKNEVSIISASGYGTEVVIPDVVKNGENEYLVTGLGSALFRNSNITKVTLPKSLKVLGGGAFGGCPKLRASFGWLCPKLCSNTFDSTATLIVPLSAAAAYKYSPDWKIGTSYPASYPDWKKYFGQITFIDDIMKISTKALSDKSGIENVIGATEVSKVTALKVTGTINSYDIFIIRTKMYDLHYLDLTDADIVACDFPYYESCHTSDNEVGDNAFRDLKNLISLKLPNNAKVIGGYAVYGCPNLCEVILPEKLEKIGWNSFEQCEKLVSIPFPPYLREIGQCAFNSCESLKDVSFPSNLQSIYNLAFSSCESLTEVRFPSSIQSVGERAFAYCPIKKVRYKVKNCI